MSLTRIDETWLQTVAEHALRQPRDARGATLEKYCRDPELSSAIKRTLDAYSEADLGTGGALAGPLWNDLLAVLGATAGPPSTALETPVDDKSGRGTGGARFGRLGRLRIERLLSSGGMGRVYEAYDELLERRVALKVLHGDQRLSPHARARFLREAQLSSRLDHPHVCRLYDLIEDGGVEALVLELIEGQSLAQRLDCSTPDTAETLRIGKEMASGLAAAHGAGIVHRDLKPGNVMLTAEGAVKIVDFGIARGERPADDRHASGSPVDGHSSPFKTRHGTTLGTLAYMSPEQARGEIVGPETDIFAFGLVLREMLTGSKAYPADGSPADLWPIVAERRIESYDQVDAPVRGVLDRMLAERPSDRPTAADVLGELEILTGSPGGGRQRRLAAAAVAAAALTLFAVMRPTAEAPIFPAGAQPRVAVLPIENRSGDDGFAWVRSGLAEMITESLTTVPSLEVIDADEVRALVERRPAAVTAEAAVSALGADVVIQSAFESVADGQYRLTYRLERPGFRTRSRRATGADPFAAAAEMAAASTRRLAPGAPLPDLRETFSSDPFANRLYASALAALSEERGYAAEPFLRALLQLAPDVVEAQLRLCEALNLQGQWQTAAELAERIAAENPDRPLVQLAALISLSNSAFGRDDREAAAAWAEKAVEASRHVDNADDVAQAHYALARILRFLDPARAGTELERAQELSRSTGNRLAEANAIQLHGVLLDERGETPAASERFTAALEIARELENPRLEGILLDNLALISQRTGQNAIAVDLLEQAAELHRETRNPRSLIFTYNNLGDCRQELGLIEPAEAAMRKGEELCAETDAPEPCALLAFNFAELLLVTGRPDEALALIERSEAFYGVEDPDNIWLRSMHRVYFGDIAAARQELDTACAGTVPERCAGYREGFADATRRAQERSAPAADA
ncbi:MAG: protein kinase [Acidobacteriota bacterium]